MKLSSKILNKIHESVESASDADYIGFNEIINALIKDEEEAVAGYENAIATLSEKMTDFQINEIHSVLHHIVLEEKEHIEELKKLQSDIDITSWK